jgi:hypothetical protein
MTKLLLGVAAAVLLLGAFGASPASAQAMQPGMWEITASMEMPGMSMPPRTMTQCIRDTDNPDNLIPKDQNCVIESRSKVGNRLSWTMRCTMDGTVMTGRGELTMSGSSYEGASQMTVREGSGEAMSMSSKYSARRLGNC